jgi:hypothetical protein
MKTLILAAIRCSRVFTAVAALSFAYPASLQADTTYQYTGNPFTDVSGPYTTGMFVTAIVTLAAPLPPNFSGDVTPTAFTFFDGVQTLTTEGEFFFVTTRDHITQWSVVADVAGRANERTILSSNLPDQLFDEGFRLFPMGAGINFGPPGVWTTVSGAVPDAGSTLLLMTLTLMALGLVARRFQRAAG